MSATALECYSNRVPRQDAQLGARSAAGLTVSSPELQYWFVAGRRNRARHSHLNATIAQR